jgi:lipase (class 3)
MITGIPVLAQLRPGFSKKEYIEMLKVTAQVGDSAYVNSFPKPEKYTFIRRSQVTGLDNQWDLFISSDKIAVISIRGTTLNNISWLANFYAAMVPAKGVLKISENEKFEYDLADNPKAAVHIGWLVSTGFLSKDMLPVLDSCYKAGFRDFIIAGHSQGGAIAFLLRSYLNGLQKQAKFPSDIRIKTYCSAGPKPGNLYYAYDYEALTANGWGYNVVNTADWVPETPVSIQTLSDFNTTNPFVNIKPIIKKQKLPKNIFVRYAYNRMYKPARRAQKNYQKYLGRMVSKSIKQHIKGFEPPAYYPSISYMRAGTTIILNAKQDYYQKFPDNPKNVFIHHLHPPYLYLAEQLKD